MLQALNDNTPHTDTAPKTPRRPPGRLPNAQLRPREYLLHSEVHRLSEAAGGVGRHRVRDKAIVLVSYYHGLRVSELTSMQWAQVDFGCGTLHVNRLKNGNPAVHFLLEEEVKLLKKLDRKCEHMFASERSGKLSRTAINKIIERAGRLASMPFPVHPHMLRHACGYYLANKGVDTRTIQDYLGHKSIHHTVRYTQLAPEKFKGLWI